MLLHFDPNNYQLKHKNKLQTEAFYFTGNIEKYGTGFKYHREWFADYPNIKLNIIKRLGNDKTGYWQIII